MQPRRVMVFVFALALAAAPAVGYMKESRQKVDVKADGTVQVKQTWVLDRSLLEQQLGVIEQMQRGFGPSEDEGEEAGAKEADGGTADKGPEVTAETQAGRKLAARVLRLFEEGIERGMVGASAAIRSVAVAEKTVTMVVTLDFENLSDFIASTPSMFEEYGFRRLVVDADDQGRLRLTFTGQPEVVRAAFRQRLRAMLTSQKYKGDLRLTFPGEIVSSTLPETEGATTGISVDATDKESLEAYIKFLGTKQMVVCEPGDLAMDDLPLDSQALVPRRMGHSADEYDDVPITDAGEGFVAEPLGVTTRTVHVFPGAAERLGEAAGMFLSSEPSGCLVKAKLYAPAERSIMRTGGTRVIKAVDDKGRDIQQAAVSGYGGVHFSGDATNTADLTLHLELPPPHARAIERLEAETIAVTFGGWKERVFRNVRADADKQHDLGALVTGAAMTVKKIVFEKPEDSIRAANVHLEVTGPSEIRRLKFEAQPASGRAMDSHVGSSSYRPKGDKTVAQLELMVFFRGTTGAEEPTIHVTAKVPEDLKRERVRITMKGIDLY